MSAPPLGVSFSHRHAAWLGLDPRATFTALLRETGVRRVRLSAHWDEIAPEPSRLDFAPLVPWLEAAARHDATVLMTVGLKAQRHPEFYPPDWLTAQHQLPHGAKLTDHPRVVALLLLMLERLVAFLADFDVIEAWQVENEPFLPLASRTVGWEISPGLLAREVEIVREVDPRGRPIVVTHGSKTAFDRWWALALQSADVLGQDVYPRRPLGRGLLRYWNAHRMGPFAPPLRRQARLARRVGKEFWITELQAEPWELTDMLTIAPERIGSVSPEQIRRNLSLAQRVEAERVYLWGAEWWRFMAERHGDRRYLELAAELFGGAGGPHPPAPSPNTGSGGATRDG